MELTFSQIKECFAFLRQAKTPNVSSSELGSLLDLFNELKKHSDEFDKSMDEVREDFFSKNKESCELLRKQYEANDGLSEESKEFEALANETLSKAANEKLDCKRTIYSNGLSHETLMELVKGIRVAEAAYFVEILKRE